MPRKPKTPEQIEHDRKYRQMHLQMMKDFVNTPNEDDISDADLLAVLLSFSMPKCDYKKAAEDLLELFGSYYNVFNFRTDTLMKIGGLKLNTALMIKGVSAMRQKMLLEEIPKRMYIKTPQDARLYLRPYFVGYTYERAYLLLLNKQKYPRVVMKIGEGCNNEVYIDENRIMREALMQECPYVILAHSHPGRDAKPSQNDKISTVSIAEMLSIVHVKMLDHLIFARGACYYMSEDEEMDSSILAFSKRKPVSIFEK